ncbi:IS66 family transposase [Escherichia coli]|uniref:IS66 family transposase n=1 Tax=Escherichia coli TaxID=562 RepID=UPI003B4350F4
MHQQQKCDGREALKRISELYAIEDEIRGLPESERLAVRKQRSKALLTSHA